MKRITFLMLLAFTTAILSAHHPSFAENGQTLSPEVKGKLEKLKKEENPHAILALWETSGKPYYSYIDEKFLQALLSFPRAKCITLLLAGMKSEREPVSFLCLKTLAKFKEERALKYLVERVVPPPLSAEHREIATELAKDLGHDEYEKRKAARNGLTALGPAMAEALRPLLKHDDMEVAHAAKTILAKVTTRLTRGEAHALGRFDDPAALPAFRRILEDTQYDDEINKNAAFKFLGNYGSPDDAEIIRPYLGGPETAAAIGALGRLRDKESVPRLISLLEEGRYKYPYQIIQALGIIGDKRALEPLLEDLAKCNGTSKGLYHIVALARLGYKKPLYEFIETASEMDLAAAFQLVFGACCREDEEVILARMAKLQGVMLQDSITAELYGSLIASTAWHLSRIAARGDRNAIAAIRRARTLAEEKGGMPPYNAVSISISLLRLGDPMEEKTIIARAKDKEAKVRYEALTIISQANVERYLPFLMDACKDRAVVRHANHADSAKIEVREAAIRGITSISGEPFHLWDFDRDRQVKEIKAWWQKYQEQKAAEEKAKESNSSDVKNNEK